MRWLRHPEGSEYLKSLIETDQAAEFDDDETYRYFNRQVVWKAFEEYVRPKWQAANEEFGIDAEEQALNPHSNNFKLWEADRDF